MTSATPIERLEQASELPYGRTRTLLVEEALRAAEAQGDPAEVLGIRVELISCYQHTRQPLQVLSTFARCVADYDAAPHRYGPWVDYSLRWDYKWLSGLLVAYPEVGLDQTYAVLDEMETRYRAGGYSLQAVYQARCRVARHVGQAELAEKWYSRWVETRRDENSDCEGCEPSSRVAYLAWQERDDEAVRLAGPVLGGELSCREQPHGILTRLLFPYLRTGQHDAAVAAHRQSYRVLRGQQHRLGSLATHLEFCARTGNEARGLELLERHLGWYDNVASAGDQMRFAAAAALLLRRVDESGIRVEQTVRRQFDENVRQIPLADLQEELHTRALKLAAKFDIRNSSSTQGAAVRRTLEAEPLVERLPIKPHHRSTARPPAPRAEVVDALVQDDLTRFEPAQLLDLAEDLWRRRRVQDAAPQLRRYDELAARTSFPLVLEARRADLRGAELVSSGDLAGGAALWEGAARLHAEVGDEERRQQALGRLGTLRCQLGGIDEGVSMVEESTEYLWDRPSASVRAAAVIRLARTYLMAGRLDEALDVVDQAALLAEHSGYAIDRDDVAFFHGQLLAAADERLEEGREIAARARDGYREHDLAALPWACLLHAELLARTEGKVEDIEAAWTEALSAAGTNIELRGQVHAARGRWLLDAGRSEEAAGELSESVAQLSEHGATVTTAMISVDLARAYLSTGRELDAAETAEEILPQLEQLGPEVEPLVNGCRFVLAGALAAVGEREAAAAEFGRLAGFHARHGDWAGSGRWFETAAELLEHESLDDDAAEAFGAAGGAFAEAGDPIGEVRCRRRQALSIGWSGETEQALEILSQAGERLARVPEQSDPAVVWENGWLGYAEARMLAGDGRYREALVRAEHGVTRFETLVSAGLEGADDALDETSIWCETLRDELSVAGGAS